MTLARAMDCVADDWSRVTTYNCVLVGDRNHPSIERTHTEPLRSEGFGATALRKSFANLIFSYPIPKGSSL